MPTNIISITDITKRESCKQLERLLNDIKKTPNINIHKRITINVNGTRKNC